MTRTDGFVQKQQDHSSEITNMHFVGYIIAVKKINIGDKCLVFFNCNPFANNQITSNIVVQNVVYTYSQYINIYHINIMLPF